MKSTEATGLSSSATDDNYSGLVRFPSIEESLRVSCSVSSMGATGSSVCLILRSGQRVTVLRRS